MIFSIIEKLEKEKFNYEIRHYSYDSLMLKVKNKYEYWEIEFPFTNEELIIEIFKSDSVIFGEEKFQDLLQGIFLDKRSSKK